MDGQVRNPGIAWTVAERPEEMGWSSSGLESAYRFAAAAGSSAIMVIQDGIVVSQWGDVAAVSGVASIRKSLLSALIGLHVASGVIDLSMTLADLDIDDIAPSLTPVEKQATIADLLTSRSGVYHAAADQDPAVLPPRGAHRPGEQWFYNNWGFNILGVILAHRTGVTLADDFAARLAVPMRMQDFKEKHFYSKSVPQSQHPAYKIRMSARDLARIGVLFLENGQWDGLALLPADWVAASSQRHAEAVRGLGYGYSWWVGVERLAADDPSGATDAPCYWASGLGNQYVMVIPSISTVIVHRIADVDQGLDNGQVATLQALILGSRLPLKG